MNIYLDMNVVFDYLLGRAPYGEEAAQILTLLRRSDVNVFMAPNAMIMGFAILRQDPNRMSPQQIKHSLALFRKEVDCVPVENSDVDEAIGLSVPDDLEDGFQIVLALKCRADLIISNDRNGFKSSSIKVLTTANFLLQWEI